MTEQDYKAFFDDAPLALLRTDLESGQFLMANKFAANLFGYKTVEELLSKSANDFYSASSRNRLIKRLKKTGILENQEIQMQLPNGKKIWVKANLRINCGGTCIECFLADITELVELRENELIKMKSLADKIDVRIATLAS